MEKIINELKSSENIIKKIILSDTKAEAKKIIVHPIILKNKMLWQVEKYVGTQVFHSNLPFKEVLDLSFNDYKQIAIEKIGETAVFSKNSSGYKQKTIKNKIENINLDHNKSKNYLINEGDKVPALVDLGVFTKDYKIVKPMFDKFKQINKFIEIIHDAYKNENMNEITILDFGCGKSYLTFLVYYYFVEIKHIKAKIIGYDIKKDVVENCNKIAKKYGYDGLVFELSDVKKDELYSGKIDMVISLHACDTATDFALNFAIKNKVKNIFSVPCCQHEINLSIKQGGDFDILLKDGLIKERFCALLTDAYRVEILRENGYSVDVIEFVDFAHSPKNLMIRAKKNSTVKKNDSLEKLQKKYQFSQTLLNLSKIKE